MANYGPTTTHRPSATPPLLPPTSQSDETKDSSPRNIYTLTLSFPFNIPSTPESAAVRTVRNLQRLGLYYAIFIWTVLFIALVPQRKVSIVYLVATTEVTFLYFLLLRALPNSIILHRIIDRRFVLCLLFVVASLEMILTHAAVHLFIVLGATVPIVMLHAVLMKSEDVYVNDGAGEMAHLLQEKLGDAESQPENLV